MKNKGLAILLALLFVFGFSSQAFAEVGIDEAGVKGVFIDPISAKTLTQAELDAGYLVNVTGYVGFLSAINAGGNPTNPKLTLLKFEIQKDLGIWEEIAILDETFASEMLVDRLNVPGKAFTFPWTITEIGNFSLKVTAVFTKASEYPFQFDTENVVVTLVQNVLVDYPAAPAVAASILQEKNIKPKYGRLGNYISDVAKMMGSSDGDLNGSWFMGINKIDTQAYYNAVYEYLDINLNAF
ncbi:MAG: hypothetical protein WBI17_00280 [Clostridiaceae bacterium]